MMLFFSAEKPKTRRNTRSAIVFAVLAALLAVCQVTKAQSFDKVIPIGDWAQFITVQFDGKPILVHLRTGYERPIIFPEPITLVSVNTIPVTQGVVPTIPSCNIEGGW